MNISKIENSMVAGVKQFPARTAFASVSCSACGNSFGPGFSGYSSCAEHRQPEISFFSHTIGAELRCVLEIDEERLDYQFGAVNPGVDVVEIWLGTVDLGPHLEANSSACILGEARIAAAKKAARSLECAA